MSDADARNFISLVFEGYKERKAKGKLYSIDDKIPENIIITYYKHVKKPEFSLILDEYKRRYIDNEALVEKNDTEEERKGLSLVYDYIKQFDYDKKKFNVFVCAMEIHQKLYKFCPNPSFGGQLRDSQAILRGTFHDVMDAVSAKKFFNDFIANSDNISKPLENGDIIGYINNCVKVTTDLIKAQPFNDGNKRTFRALLNLMLKRINIPPIYIERHERNEYKNCLIKAINDNDYTPITRFYYYKICDAIVQLDLYNSYISFDNNLGKVK